MRLPRSQTTIWKILRLFSCIAQEHRRKPKPLERKQAGEEVQLDLKDATTVPADPEGKRQHVVDMTNFVDAGTSIWLSRSVGGDFDAESLLEVVAQFLRERGLPAMLPFDNDPRFVGSASGRDFPSALLRMLLCVGVEPHVCPPHRPDKNADVERFHRTLGDVNASHADPGSFVGRSQQESPCERSRRRWHQEQETRDDGDVRLAHVPVMLEKREDAISMSRKKYIPVFLHQEVFSFLLREEQLLPEKSLINASIEILLAC